MAKKTKKVVNKSKKTSKPFKTKAKAKKALPVPKGYHTVQSHLIVHNAAEAIAWYGRAFGAKERYRMPGPDGRLLHAEIQIGDSIVMLSDDGQGPDPTRKSPTELQGTHGGLMLYVKDVDAWFTRAQDAGAKVTMPLADMFWGDRYGQLVDPFGHVWAIATHKVDLTPKQMQKASEEAFKQMGQPQAA